MSKNRLTGNGARRKTGRQNKPVGHVICGCSSIHLRNASTAPSLFFGSSFSSSFAFFRVFSSKVHTYSSDDVIVFSDRICYKACHQLKSAIILSSVQGLTTTYLRPPWSKLDPLPLMGPPSGVSPFSLFA